MQQQKTAIITGAAGNLGKAVIEKFLKEDYAVTGTINKIDNTANKNFNAVQVDLTDEDASAKFVASLIEKYKQIKVAVLTVGGFEMGDISNTKASDIFNQYKLNFETAYNIARPVFLQMLQQQSGIIFLVGSKPGLHAKNSKGMIAYGLSKSLLFRLAELMNDEAAALKNVVVKVIVPSTIDTPQNRKAMPSADFSRWQKPEAIADVIFQHAENANKEDDFIIEI